MPKLHSELQEKKWTSGLQGELLDGLKILALSWKEPYATLMLKGKIETRTWPTNYRGRVLICATKVPYSFSQVKELSGAHQLKRICDILENISYNKLSSHGMAIAVGRLVNCREMLPADEDKCFVKFSPRLFCHVYEDVRPIKPMAWKGKQGWTNVSLEIIRSVEFL